MAKVMIAFASRSGNTEEIAFLLEENLKKYGIDVSLKEIGLDNIEENDFLEHDGILLGSYTEGDGDIPYETEDFFEELDGFDLSGKPAALFGSCDSLYPHYGGAVDQFEDKLKERGALIQLESLKIELMPEKEDEQKCEAFAKHFVEAVRQETKV